MHFPRLGTAGSLRGADYPAGGSPWFGGRGRYREHRLGDARQRLAGHDPGHGLGIQVISRSGGERFRARRTVAQSAQVRLAGVCVPVRVRKCSGLRLLTTSSIGNRPDRPLLAGQRIFRGIFRVVHVAAAASAAFGSTRYRGSGAVASVRPRTRASTGGEGGADRPRPRWPPAGRCTARIIFGRRHRSAAALQ